MTLINCEITECKINNGGLCGLAEVNILYHGTFKPSCMLCVFAPDANANQLDQIEIQKPRRPAEPMDHETIWGVPEEKEEPADQKG